jgi:hypothetical protein
MEVHYFVCISITYTRSKNISNRLHVSEFNEMSILSTGERKISCMAYEEHFSRKFMELNLRLTYIRKRIQKNNKFVP